MTVKSCCGSRRKRHNLWMDLAMWISLVILTTVVWCSGRAESQIGGGPSMNGRVRIGREGLWYVYRHPFEEFGCKRRAQVVAPGGMVVESWVNCWWLEGSEGKQKPCCGKKRIPEAGSFSSGEECTQCCPGRGGLFRHQHHLQHPLVSGCPCSPVVFICSRVHSLPLPLYSSLWSSSVKEFIFCCRHLPSLLVFQPFLSLPSP